VETRVEGEAHALRRLEAQRAGRLGGLDQPLAVVGRQHADGGHDLGAVREPQALLGGQLERRHADRAQPLGRARREAAVQRPGHVGPAPRAALPPVPGGRAEVLRAARVDAALRVAHQDEREVRQRREVAAAPDRPLLRHERVDVPVQEVEEALDDQGAHPRVADGQRAGAQQDGRAHGVLGEGRADAHRVRPDEVALERLRVRAVDRDVPLRAEARREPVDGRLALHERLDDGAAARDAAARLVGEVHAGAVARDGDHLGDRQPVAAQHDLADGLGVGGHDGDGRHGRLRARSRSRSPGSGTAYSSRAMRTGSSANPIAGRLAAGPPTASKKRS